MFGFSIRTRAPASARAFGSTRARHPRLPQGRGQVVLVRRVVHPVTCVCVCVCARARARSGLCVVVVVARLYERMCARGYVQSHKRECACTGARTHICVFWCRARSSACARSCALIRAHGGTPRRSTPTNGHMPRQSPQVALVRPRRPSLCLERVWVVSRHTQGP